MRRFMVLLGADIRFQFRYGFYAVYLIVSLLYIFVLRILPGSARDAARAVVVFSDPAALGLFFMGAILLYEKSDRVFSSLAVSPVRPLEYVMAKAASLAMVSLAAALLVQLGSGGRLDVYFIPAIVLSAMLFTLAGLCIGAHRSTLNGFLLSTVPAELALMLPALAWRFAGKPGWLLWHPGAMAMDLLETGSGSPPVQATAAAAQATAAPGMAPWLVVGLAAWIVPAAVLAVGRVQEMILRDAGGGGAA